jgi:serine/threonine protein kinase
MKKDEPNIDVVMELIEINKIPIIPLKEIKLKKKIGEGGQAKVFRGTWKDIEVAVKVLGTVDWKCFAHEIVILSNLVHKSIPKFYGMVIEDDIMATVTKFVSGSTLCSYDISYMNDDIKLSIVKQLGNVLKYIHKNNFIHRDLKPENIMLDDTGHLYLIDFGIAKICTNIDWTITRAKGTIYYLAPECLDAADYTETKDIISLITTKVDVWGFGCIVSYLYSGIVPWCEDNIDNPNVIQKLLMVKTPFQIPNKITDKKIIQVISMATISDPKERNDMASIMSVLEK